MNWFRKLLNWFIEKPEVIDMRNKHWTDGEVLFLMDMSIKSELDKNIAKELGRSIRAIQQKRYMISGKKDK